MNKIVSFAQKGFVLDPTKTKILANKYLTSKYFSQKVNGKYGLPGGQIEFGEGIDQSFIREVKEETGITITPSTPIHIYTWVYQKDDSQKQIIAVARIAYYKSGEIKDPDAQKETTLEKARWLQIKNINPEDFIWDERPAIKKFLEYQKHNPFLA